MWKYIFFLGQYGGYWYLVLVGFCRFLLVLVGFSWQLSSKPVKIFLFSRTIWRLLILGLGWLLLVLVDSYHQNLWKYFFSPRTIWRLLILGLGWFWLFFFGWFLFVFIGFCCLVLVFVGYSWFWLVLVDSYHQNLWKYFFSPRTIWRLLILPPKRPREERAPEIKENFFIIVIILAILIIK